MERSVKLKKSIIRLNHLLLFVSRIRKMSEFLKKLADYLGLCLFFKIGPDILFTFLSKKKKKEN